MFSFIGSHFILVATLAFYCACGLWRLAYYNVIEGDGYFTGLPVPGAMLIISMATWSVVYYNFPSWVLYLALFGTGLLMVSFIKLRKYGLWQKTLWVLGLVFLAVIITA